MRIGRALRRAADNEVRWQSGGEMRLWRGLFEAPEERVGGERAVGDVAVADE